MNHSFLTAFAVLLFCWIASVCLAQSGPPTPHFVLVSGNNRDGKIYCLVHQDWEDEDYHPKETWYPDAGFDVDKWRRHQRRVYAEINWIWIEYIYSVTTRGGVRVFLPVPYDMLARKYDSLYPDDGD